MSEIPGLAGVRLECLMAEVAHLPARSVTNKRAPDIATMLRPYLYVLQACLLLNRALQPQHKAYIKEYVPEGGAFIGTRAQSQARDSPQCVLQECVRLEKPAQDEAHHKLWLHSTHMDVRVES